MANIFGGAGNDILPGTDGDDFINGLAGNDSLTGNQGDDTLNGGTGNDKMAGGAGNDTLTDREGGDALKGGVGNDVYVIGAAPSTIVEAAGAGVDEIRVVNLGNGLIFSLETLVNVENLTFLGGADDLGLGNKLANKITGGAGANQLFGLDGNDTLDGGEGLDELTGGFGNDIFLVDDAGDVVADGKGQGRDTVLASGSYQLANDQEIEQLILTGIGDTTATGNNFVNTITGNSGHNTLFGGGGDDVMAGGKGDDTYTVEQIGDKIVEAANAGIDTVQSQLERYTLGANVENLTLTIGIDGTGNGLANEITGNLFANKLDGGAGNDKLFGLDGADTLIGGTGSDELFGGNDIDTLISGAGEDSLEGGFGADILDGGAGLDNFIYKVDNASDLAQLGGDTIQGFTRGIDQIDIRDLLGDDPNDFELAFDTHVDLQATGKDTQIFFDNVLLATVTNVSLTQSDFALTF